jgi:hypothetical protein
LRASRSTRESLNLAAIRVGVSILINGQPLFRNLLGGASTNIQSTFDFQQAEVMAGLLFHR